MSWLFSRALVAEYLEANCSDGELSAQLNGNDTQLAYCAPDKMTAFSRSGMWKHMARIICEVRPNYVFVENSPILTSRGLGTVLGDLASMGFDARWGVLGHDDIGGQHKRERIWIVANSDKRIVCKLVKRKSKNKQFWQTKERDKSWIDFLVAHDGNSPPAWRVRGQEFITRPIMRRNSDGMADGMDRIAAIGNGQVPIVAATAWRLLGGPVSE
jgi:DNA (cytosine-5)-methyltransferase 1